MPTTADAASQPAQSWGQERQSSAYDWHTPSPHLWLQQSVGQFRLFSPCPTAKAGQGGARGEGGEGCCVGGRERAIHTLITHPPQGSTIHGPREVRVSCRPPSLPVSCFPKLRVARHSLFRLFHPYPSNGSDKTRTPSQPSSSSPPLTTARAVPAILRLHVCILLGRLRRRRQSRDIQSRRGRWRRREYGKGRRRRSGQHIDAAQPSP